MLSIKLSWTDDRYLLIIVILHLFTFPYSYAYGNNAFVVSILSFADYPSILFLAAVSSGQLSQSIFLSSTTMYKVFSSSSICQFLHSSFSLSVLLPLGNLHAIYGFLFAFSILISNLHFYSVLLHLITHFS